MKEFWDLKPYGNFMKRIIIKRKKHNFFSCCNGWNIEFDNTDHFQFYCPKCKKRATVWNILFGFVTGMPIIYFELRCDKCKIQGARKIYLNEKEEL